MTAQPVDSRASYFATTYGFTHPSLQLARKSLSMPRGCSVPSTWKAGLQRDKREGSGSGRWGLLHAEKPEGENLVQGFLSGRNTFGWVVCQEVT